MWKQNIMTIVCCIIISLCFYFYFCYFTDIFPSNRLTDTRIAARRTIVGNFYSATNPVSWISRPERLRQTESERYRRTVCTTECQKVYVGQGLAVVATVGQDHAFIKRSPDWIRAQTKIREYLGYTYIHTRTFMPVLRTKLCEYVVVLKTYFVFCRNRIFI